MLLQTQGDVIAVLGIAAAILLFLSIVGGVIAALKSFQVRQFQDLLFKAERKIDTLERRMFNVLNAVPVALVETDSSGKFTFANKAAHQLLGRKDSELIGLRFHSATWGITYPDGRMIPPDLMPIARTLRGQTVKGFQHMLTNHGSHDKFLVSVTSMPIVSSTGEVTGASAAMVELETQAGQGVDDLTGLWRGQWFATATVPFWGLDANGRILDVNGAALEAFGLRREDVLNQNWTQAFVSDADFRAAMDYLAEALNGEPHGHKSVTVMLKDRDGSERRTVVTAWMVRTHENGDRGLTVMAMPAAGEDAVGDETALAAPAMSDDAHQELLDLRNAETARAALGVGVWQYDAEADTIVEDEGMQRLIGREEPGGPTLISDAGQAAADTAFARLLSGETDTLDLDIEVVHKDGSLHWIALKGQATQVDGERRIFGVAIDTTPWKRESPVVETMPAVTGISEADHEAALAAAVAEARREAREQALAEAAAEAATADVARADVYAWSTPERTEPVVIRESDPAVVAENEALRARIDDLQAELDRAHGVAADAETVRSHAATLQAELEQVRAAGAEAEALREHLATIETELTRLQGEHGDLSRELEALHNAPPPAPQVVEREVPVIQPDPAVVAENEALRAQLQRAQANLAQVTGDFERSEAQRNELQVQLNEIFLTPQPVPDTSEHEARIADLETQLAQARDSGTRLELQLLSLNAARAQLETQLAAAREAREQAEAELGTLGNRHGDAQTALADAADRAAHLQSALDELRAERDALQARYDELAAKPVPQPDYAPHEARIKALQFELTKWQAAYQDAHARLEAAQATIDSAPKAPTVDIDALTSRLEQLQNTVNLSHAQQAQLQQRLNEMHTALAHAQRFETVGRLTTDVAADFAQMLSVINSALETMSRTPDSPDSVRRLSQAALAAGKRGERLTRQLQAFQTEDY
jgi:PAS domain S-box-containing protein